MFSDFQFVPDQGEQVIGQYKTYSVASRGHPSGNAGILIITDRRVIFYKKENVLKKLIKAETPNYTPFQSIPITSIYKVTNKGGLYPSIVINGTFHHIESASPRTVAKMVKTMIKEAKRKPTVMQPAPVVPVTLANPIASQAAPATTVAKKFCQECGVENKMDGHYCVGCGAKLEK